MPDKLTDKEILNAAKCCTIGDCRGCFYGDTDQRRCRDDLIKNLVDLVNQKQAENERLKEKFEISKQMLHNTLPLVEEDIKTIQTEAYKECIEKVKERIAVHSFTSNSTEYTDGMLDCMEWVDSKIEELKKELVGEDNGKEKE